MKFPYFDNNMYSFGRYCGKMDRIKGQTTRYCAQNASDLVKS